MGEERWSKELRGIGERAKRTSKGTRLGAVRGGEWGGWGRGGIGGGSRRGIRGAREMVKGKGE